VEAAAPGAAARDSPGSRRAAAGAIGIGERRTVRAGASDGAAGAEAANAAEAAAVTAGPMGDGPRGRRAKAERRSEDQKIKKVLGEDPQQTLLDLLIFLIFFQLLPVLREL
jgi:hypothetical protein